ncbi:phenazine-specific anthranilate synthase component I [Lentzea tibetensis]|uniref:anthranilate synthase n=1 Tax=Lentzea tibetensis TaxID=2591470 RepID=A0A563ESB3_9PSEU|nr:anthranilate synthase family protein [Lentzea tibetensis]TWP50543.1 phenazine-specific anthranilate synthase component I [Lentzea tibetensis]
MTAPFLLDDVFTGRAGPFALLHRPDATGHGVLDVLTGPVSEHETLDDLPLPAGDCDEVLALVPYRQLTERGFACHDDGTPLVALTVTASQRLPLTELLAHIPDVPTPVIGGRFDLDDDTYASTVRRVIEKNIGAGEGANFVLKRSFTADIGNYGPLSAPAFFRRLLTTEKGAYWTFLVHTGERTLVGASPERHVSLNDGTVVMNPISGTYRYPPTGPTPQGVLEFLEDQKETDELYMVLDEELKMMARICESGGRVIGPRLKEMARVAHTEYFIEGRSTRDVREILRETMFAPTVTGSPLENACRAIRDYEPGGRGYYSGAAALIGWDARGEQTLDSAILIRTADIDRTGRVRIDVGATIVRHSNPESEAAETSAKAAALVAALESERTTLGTHPSVRAALARRNDTIADFWLSDFTARADPHAGLTGREVLVIDAEDSFTAMIGHQLTALGLRVTVRGHDEDPDDSGYDLVVMGPGPGDPRDLAHPRIGFLHRRITRLLAESRPFLAVCLSHQVLSLLFGLDLHRREQPNQGVQAKIDLFGSPAQAGFYNTFAALSTHDEFTVDGVGRVEVARDPETNEVHALRGNRFASMQFHPESVLTADGPQLVGATLLRLLGRPAAIEVA